MQIFVSYHLDLPNPSLPKNNKTQGIFTANSWLYIMEGETVLVSFATYLELKQ